MKRILLAAVAMVFVACAHFAAPKLSGYEAEVFIAPEFTWANQCPRGKIEANGRCSSPIRSVTVRVYNQGKAFARRVIECRYQDGPVFGRRRGEIRAGDYTTYLVWGFSRWSLPGGSHRVVCRLVP